MESNFVISVVEPLGAIKELILWHDNSGYNPSWFIETVRVRDLKFKKEYNFLIYDWISYRFGKDTKLRCSVCSEAEYQSQTAVKRWNQLYSLLNDVWWFR